jgi:putative endonuclease
MLNKRQRLGQSGEEIATKFLKKNGYKIVKRNYRSRLGEIDIIAMDGSCLVFIEVKTRSGNLFGSPADAVTVKKQRQISKAALCYLSEKQLHDDPARFDVVSILFRGEDHQIDLIQNAFELCA